MNYQAELYITRTEETENYFQRFEKVKIEGKPYEIQAVDRLSNPGILTVKLKETYQNTIQEQAEEEEKESQYIYVLKIKSYDEITQTAITPVDSVQNDSLILIKTDNIIGPEIVYPYDRVQYFIDEDLIGTWKVDEPKKVRILNQNNSSVTLEIITSRKGEFNLSFVSTPEDIRIRKINIGSL